MEFERPTSQAIGSEGLPKMFAILFSVFFLSDFGFDQLNVENRRIVLYVMIGLEVKVLQLVDVSGCPVDSGLDVQVIFHMDLGFLKNQDPIPIHFYGKLYVRVDSPQVFSEVFSVVAVQLSV